MRALLHLIPALAPKREEASGSSVPALPPAAVEAFFRFVKLAAPIAERLPAFPGSALLATALNVAFGASGDGLEHIVGKRIAIRVTDAGLRFHFAVTRAGFVAVRERGWPAVTISATARDFVDIAARRVDPDTLFFARRLVVEGETESGLALKNRLDALDPAVLARPPGPGELLRALATALGAPPGAQAQPAEAGAGAHF
jgi:O2-independent ubiquinone biosynthesis accessory factor UbiT